MLKRPFDPYQQLHAYCLPFGAHLVGGQTSHPRTRFRFWAPSRECVQLEIQDAGCAKPELIDMDASGDGWFEAQADAGAGALYRYRLDEGLAVPDPVSRFQPQDVHGPSEVVDPRAYRWTNTDWHGRPWEETVLYELHIGAMGGYRRVITRLPELVQLGITAIELMPVNDFSGRRNWGYDGVLPYAPDSAYGRPEALKQLIDAAHGLGLMVFLDVVYNHFGPDGNYLHAYAKTFFREGENTPWGPAIDFERPQVRDFFFENALYWLNEYRFDGLRLDAVHAIDNDAWLGELADRIRSSVEADRSVHLVLENERNTASLLEKHFEAQWNDDAHNTLHVLLTGENEGYYRAYSERPIEKLARVLSEGFVYQGDPSPVHGGTPWGERSTHLPPTAFVMFLQNHDQVGNRAMGERLRSLADDDSIRVATCLLLLSPQIPLLFMEEQYGSRRPFLFFTDYPDELADGVREGRRREFEKFSAFADEKRRAQIPDPNNRHTFELSSSHGVDEYESDRLDWLYFYRSVLTVRAQLITPRLKSARALGADVLGEKALIAGWRLGDGETLRIAFNFGAAPVALANEARGKVIFEMPTRIDANETKGELSGRSFVAWLTGDVDMSVLPRQRIE
ncbi:malto-oligosyltrehalose trehalohydrolase [Paraburkholderia unamae]|uniref:Malto-oligosyltrehalose trehalohydrolase n=1 Tax=Paraburkholderia unamae TaxID=219649 RepID=A0ABX5KLR8_9BURK|nr:malto-oligosyltrehalose trehalohydrolase [Paraburkholderia unamae]PVX81388.1 maltooligosyl trehalose hydrolase [Paraburkholderia unamae]